MREITESQAQELANLSGCEIRKYWRSGQYEIAIKNESGILIDVCALPIFVKSKRNSAEQVWRPE